MIKYIFAVYDKQAEQFVTDFTDISPGLAIRGFEDALKNPEIAMSKHPEDFDLYQLGTMETDTGLMEQPSTGPYKLLTGLSVTQVNMTKEEYHESIGAQEVNS